MNAALVDNDLDESEDEDDSTQDTQNEAEFFAELDEDKPVEDVTPARKILRLTTEEIDAPPGEVFIDGNRYEYADPTVWNLAVRTTFRKNWSRLQKLENVRNIGPHEDAMYRRAGGKCVSMAIPSIPTNIVEKLKPALIDQLLIDFFLKTGERAPAS